MEAKARSFQLSAEELDQFHEKGYIGPVTLYEPDEMAEKWKVIRRQVLDRSHAPYTSDASVLSSISDYDRHLDIDLLAEHVCHPGIVDRIASIFGPDVLCWRTEFFPKYPGDEGTDWHQADTFAHASGQPQLLWPGETETSFGKGAITAWTAFTESTRENGCLQIIPGTHREMYYDESKGMHYQPESYRQDKGGVTRGFFGYDYRQLQKDPNWRPAEEDAVPLVMHPGQCVIFWSTLMHASLPNISKTSVRMGFAARYVPTSVRVYPDTDVVEEYGGTIRLDNYGTVLVSGQDAYGHNRRRDTTLRDKRFPARNAVAAQRP
jgi:non-heme Fe2+,alpha-ketoglutarate-dependent halogenase